MASPVEQLQLSGVHLEGDEPSEQVARVVSMLLALLRDRFISLSWYQREFERSVRQYARDLKHLRQLGAGFGMKISNQKRGRVNLVAFSGKGRLTDGPSDTTGIIKTIARVLGVPIQKELGIDNGPEQNSGFVMFALPSLIEGSAAAARFQALRDAQRNNARARFRYRAAKAGEVRVVEPYRVLVRSGRYYLIGYDTAPRKGWRYFALDQMTGPISRVGTFTPRAIPARYLDCDAVGMLQGGPATDVTIRLSPTVAASATSRRWQRAQRIAQHRDGSADITLTVNDVAEAIRWALGFGSEAVVISPPSAVEAARCVVEALQYAYGLRVRRAG